MNILTLGAYMQHLSAVATPPQKRRIFYFAAIFLLLGAVIAAFVQKQYESAIAIAVAKEDDVRHITQIMLDAKYWGAVSFVIVGLAISSCSIAILRRENNQRVWAPVVVLLLLYVLLELLMV
ncbi:MAG: hypothetical protein ACRC46_04160 [Thermoguttaceae bacterium]